MSTPDANTPVNLTVGQLQDALVGALKKSGVGGNNSGDKDNPRNPTSNFGKSINRTSTALGKFTEYLTGTKTVTDNLRSLTSVLPGFIGTLGVTVADFAGYLEDTNRTFQALSKVGAGFNGDLGALRAGAAQTRMPLDQFANMIGNNAQLLTTLGGSVNQGAKRFAELSRAMFEDGEVIQGMSNLGYTLQESNEMLLENASLLGRQARLTGMTDGQVTQATLAMAENIAVMAEISGESAAAQKQDMLDEQRDGKNIAANRRKENRGIKDATETMGKSLVALGPLGSAAKAFAMDLNQTGVPMTKLTQSFETMNPKTAETIRAMEDVRNSNMSTVKKNAELNRLADKAKGQLAKESVSDTNLFAASVGQLSAIGASQAKVIEETRAFTEGVEAVQARMAEAGKGTVSTAEAAKIYLEEARNAVRAQKGGGTEGQAISRTMNEATIKLANSAAEIQGVVAKNLSANTGLQKTITSAIDTSTGFTDELRGYLNKFSQTNFGTNTAEMDKILTDRNNFTELFKGVTNGNFIRVDQIGSVSPTDILNQGRGKALGGGVTAGTAYKVGEQGPEAFVAGMDGAIIPNMKSMLNRMPDIGQQLQDQMAMMGTPITQAAKEAMATMPRGGSVEEKLDILNQTMLQLVNINTIHKDIGNKQIRTMRSAGNLMSGLGRA